MKIHQLVLSFFLLTCSSTITSVLLAQGSNFVSQDVVIKSSYRAPVISIKDVYSHFPLIQNWKLYNYNLPVYVSRFVPLTAGNIRVMKPSKIKDLMNCYSESNLISLSKVSNTQVVRYDNFVVEFLMSGTIEAVSVVYWNITHPKVQRYPDFVIKDFKMSNLEAFAIVDGSLNFYVRKNEETMTHYYYNSIYEFVNHNLGHKVSLSEYGMRELTEWLYYLPVEDITDRMTEAVRLQKKTFGSDYFKIDFKDTRNNKKSSLKEKINNIKRALDDWENNN